MRMRFRHFHCPARLFLVALLLLLNGCGTVRVAGIFTSSEPSVSIGTVSFIHLTAIFGDNGTLINVTVVTLVTPRTMNTFTFCGNQSSQFTMNSTVQVSFTPAHSCSTLVAIAPH
jgi:hypothetical protein